MKVFVALAFVVVGCSALSCKNYQSKFELSEVLGEESKWFYADTNHKAEDCNTVIYKGNATNGVWTAYFGNGEVHMTCDTWKTTEGTWRIRVWESGSEYNVKVASYEKGVGICLIQCDIYGETIDYWHCITPLDYARSEDYSATKWNETLKATGLEISKQTKIFTNFVSETCKRDP